MTFDVDDLNKSNEAFFIRNGNYSDFIVFFTDKYLVCCTLDVNTAAAASECAFDTNQNIARRHLIQFLIVVWL